MERKEPYIHTRNYGCRLRRYSYHQIDMLSLENQKIKVVIALGKGADIVELVHKPSDTDFMWHSFNELWNINHIPTVASSGGYFLDSYSGGWQELFPTHGGSTHYHGAEIGIHGEACIAPWSCEILTDLPERVEVKLSLRTVRTPFLLEKILRLDEMDATLYMSQKVTNLGIERLEFMWGHHPAFGFPFLDESVRLHLPGKPTVTVPQSAIAHHCPFDRPVTGKFPCLTGKDGKPVDVGRAYAPEDRLYMEYAVSDLTEGKYELVNHGKKLGIRMCWDRQVFPYLWVWGLYRGIDEYPWYGRSYVMAVEPWSSMPGEYDAARENGSLLSLMPDESLKTGLSAELFAWEKQE